MKLISRLGTLLNRFYILIQKAVAQLLILVLWLIRPLLGPMNICPFSIGCTQYAINQLEEQPLFLAIKNIIERLLQCHPFGKRIQ